MGDLPKGVVAIFVASDGRAVASVSDFDLSGYGGFTLEQSQTVRVKDAIAAKMADAFCSSEFTKHLDRYQRSKVMQSMVDHDGYRLHIVPVGHEEEKAE